jgi:hypothetical protein
LYRDDLYLSDAVLIPIDEFGALRRPASEIRLTGGFLSARYAGFETTPYTGIRREFVAAARLAEYPEHWGTLSHDILDLRGQLAATTPLPCWRHTLTLVAIGRAVDLGDPASFPFLRVGGLPSSVIWRHPEPESGFVDGLPNTFVFREPLPGFEDFLLATNRLAIGEAFYDLPFIIDHGWASTFGVFPSFFVRQVDLQLFGDVAFTQERFNNYDDSKARHAAQGASLSLSTVFGTTPITLGYQISRRLTDDRGVTQLVTLTD